MTAKQLRDTTLDPARRVLRRVTLDDAAIAAKLVAGPDGRGQRRAAPRVPARHAKQVEEVDV